MEAIDIIAYIRFEKELHSDYFLDAAEMLGPLKAARVIKSTLERIADEQFPGQIRIITVKPEYRNLTEKSFEMIGINGILQVPNSNPNADLEPYLLEMCHEIGKYLPTIDQKLYKADKSSN